MIVAVAFDDKVYYGRVIKTPSQKSVKLEFFVEDGNVLTMPAKPERTSNKLNFVIYVDISLDKDGRVKNVAEINRRYQIYFDEWFID